MGALRTAVDNLITALQDPTLRTAVAAIDPKWPGIMDTIITDLTANRASIPNNDRLDLLTPAQLALIDQKLTQFIDRLAYVDVDGSNTDLTTRFPAAQFYNFLEAVGAIRDTSRQLVGHG